MIPTQLSLIYITRRNKQYSGIMFLAWAVSGDNFFICQIWSFISCEMYQFYSKNKTFCNIIKQFLGLNSNFRHAYSYFDIATKAAFKPKPTLGHKPSISTCGTSATVTDVSSDCFLRRLIWHLKLSLDQLNWRTANYMTRCRPVSLTTWAPTPRCLVLSQHWFAVNAAWFFDQNNSNQQQGFCSNYESQIQTRTYYWEKVGAVGASEA